LDFLCQSQLFSNRGGGVSDFIDDFLEGRLSDPQMARPKATFSLSAYADVTAVVLPFIDKFVGHAFPPRS
jgi:hypothetical protein